MLNQNEKRDLRAMVDLTEKLRRELWSIMNDAHCPMFKTDQERIIPLLIELRARIGMVESYLP